MRLTRLIEIAYASNSPVIFNRRCWHKRKAGRVDALAVACDACFSKPESGYRFPRVSLLAFAVARRWTGFTAAAPMLDTARLV